MIQDHMIFLVLGSEQTLTSYRNGLICLISTQLGCQARFKLENKDERRVKNG